MPRLKAKQPAHKNAPAITSRLIAPCGMNCGVCLGYLREKNTCPGCNSVSIRKPPYCLTCRIKTCPELKTRKAKFCFACSAFPCRRLRQLDLRYRTKYRMSMLENLHWIKTQGIRSLVKREQARWICPACGSRLCVHRKACLVCGAEA